MAYNSKGFEGDGGGFMAGGRSDFSPNGDTPSKKSRGRNQPLVPITVKQALEAAHPNPDDDEFIIDNNTVSQVQLVAQILKVNPATTSISYQIDDGTGMIDVRLFADQDDPNSFEARKAAELHEGTYVRVIGNLKAFGSKRSLQGFRLIPIVDFNELTHHFLEVIYTHLSNTRGPVANTSAQSAYGQSNAAAASNYAPATSYGGAPQANAYQQVQRTDSGLNSLQAEILRAIKQNGEPGNGLHINAIIATCANIATADEVRKTVAWLSDEGNIFPTIDDEHYASTDD